MNARQHNGALSTRDTDNPMLMGNELTGPHQRGEVTALGASQLQIPHAYRSVAAAHRGKQLMEPIAAHLRSGRNPPSGILWTTGTSVSLWPPGPIEVSPMS